MSDLALRKNDPISRQLGFSFVSVTELSDEQKRVLKDTVAKNTTDTELAYFLNVALAQELDPFRKEVWCIKYGTNLMIQTSRDGLLKVAKRDPQFDRIQSAEVRDGDFFAMDPINGKIEHRLNTKRGDILGAYAIITRRDGAKLAKYVTFSEYVDHSSSIWKDYPSAMICKCAESVLCKQFANVTGIMAEEMIRKDGSVIDSSPTTQDEQSSLKEELLTAIGLCKTIEEFHELRESLAGKVGRLFETEREEVYAAAREKKALLVATTVEKQPEEPVVVDAEIVEPQTEQPSQPTEAEIEEAEREGMKLA